MFALIPHPPKYVAPASPKEKQGMLFSYTQRRCVRVSRVVLSVSLELFEGGLCSLARLPLLLLPLLRLLDPPTLLLPDPPHLRLFLRSPIGSRPRLLVLHWDSFECKASAIGVRNKTGIARAFRIPRNDLSLFDRTRKALLHGKDVTPLLPLPEGKRKISRNFVALQICFESNPRAFSKRQMCSSSVACASDSC